MAGALYSRPLKIFLCRAFKVFKEDKLSPFLETPPLERFFGGSRSATPTVKGRIKGRIKGVSVICLANKTTLWTVS